MLAAGLSFEIELESAQALLLSVLFAPIVQVSHRPELLLKGHPSEGLGPNPGVAVSSGVVRAVLPQCFVRFAARFCFPVRMFGSFGAWLACASGVTFSAVYANFCI